MQSPNCVVLTDKKKVNFRPMSRGLARRFLIYSVLIALIPSLFVFFNSMLYLSSVRDFFIDMSYQIRLILKDGVPLNQSQLSLDEIINSFSQATVRADQIINHIQWTSLIMVIFLLLVVVLIAVLVIIKKTRLLSELQRALIHVEESNYSKRLQINRNDEIGTLVQMLNRMFECMEKKDGIFNSLLEQDLFDSNLPKTPCFQLISSSKNVLQRQKHFSCIQLSLGQMAFMIVYPLNGEDSNYLSLFVRNYIHLFFQGQFAKYAELGTFIEQLRARLNCLAEKKLKLPIELVCGIIDFNLYKLNFINCGVKSVVYFNKADKSIQVFKSSKHLMDHESLDFIEECVHMNAGDKILFYRHPLSFRMGHKGYQIYSDSQRIHEHVNLQDFFAQISIDIVNGTRGHDTYLFELS